MFRIKSDCFWEDKYLLFIWCFFYGVITRCVSGTILFSLFDSYLITFKIGNEAKYCIIPPPSQPLDNGGKSPREQFIKHCFYQHILSCSYYCCCCCCCCCCLILCSTVLKELTKITVFSNSTVYVTFRVLITYSQHPKSLI